MAASAETAPPCTMVVFGGRGDLTARLLIPSLVNLAEAGRLADSFRVLGLGRADLDDEGYRAAIDEDIRALGRVDMASEAWRWVRERLHYLAGDFDDADTYVRLGRALDGFAAGTGGGALFYLAVPPTVFAPVIDGLNAAGLAREQGGAWRRIVVEKPFGTDLPSAQALNQRLQAVFDEDRIYRIDHYLGKETVQNIMVLRFSNGIFEPLWNRNHIDHVQISVAETVGVEQRGAFYDRTGALRDMVPNHLFQLLTLTAMEVPGSFAADAIRTEKVKVLHAVRGLDREGCLADVVRGQYQAGTIGGEPVPAYRAEARVDPASTTETFVAMKLFIDSWRWAGVPFYLRTGKRMARRSSQIAIQFKQAPLALFRGAPLGAGPVRNFLVLRLQPDEGIELRFGAKVPGHGMMVDEVAMDFRYRDHFRQVPGTGYETLLYDCMKGDPTLFQRADFIEAAWRVLQPVLNAWGERPGDVPVPYDAGGWGPSQADALLARDDRRWSPI